MNPHITRNFFLYTLLSTSTLAFGEDITSFDQNSVTPLVKRLQITENCKNEYSTTNLYCYKRAMTKEKWDGLEFKDQETLLDFGIVFRIGYKGIYKNTRLYDFVLNDVSSEQGLMVHNTAINEFFRAMNQYVKRLEMEVEDDFHSTISGQHPQLISIYTYLDEVGQEHILGGSYLLFQLDCDMPDFENDVQYFENVESAVKAGCELSDVSWSNHFKFNYNMKKLYQYADYLEWSGY